MRNRTIKAMPLCQLDSGELWWTNNLGYRVVAFDKVFVARRARVIEWFAKNSSPAELRDKAVWFVIRDRSRKSAQYA